MLRLLQNLVDNALKFRVDGRTPQITITSTVASTATGSSVSGDSGNGPRSTWQVCIADNGVGMLPDQIGRLFQVFAGCKAAPRMRAPASVWRCVARLPSTMAGVSGSSPRAKAWAAGFTWPCRWRRSKALEIYDTPGA
jgi:hypothetical protein